MTHVHSLNSSGSKQKYSFGKGQRFAPYKPKYIRHKTALMFPTCLNQFPIEGQQLLDTGKGLFSTINIMLFIHIHILFLPPLKLRKGIL